LGERNDVIAERPDEAPEGFVICPLVSKDGLRGLIAVSSIGGAF